MSSTLKANHIFRVIRKLFNMKIILFLYLVFFFFAFKYSIFKIMDSCLLGVINKFFVFQDQPKIYILIRKYSIFKI